jgi:thiamine-monophosphate kinase
MDEFERIRSCFAPLARSPGAAGLSDDVAEMDLRPGVRMIVTCDTIVEGVHFMASDPIETVAAKLVRVNVSDILAKGGRPREALLGLVWPRARPESDLALFAASLGEELAAFGACLIGGDTTAGSDGLILTLTLTGEVGTAGPVRRAGALPGDDVWVTGVIGDGWLGLCVARGDPSVSPDAREALLRRYRIPALPPLAAASLVAHHASAACDISDGLLADAGHIAEASAVAIDIAAAELPLSPEAQNWLAAAGGADACGRLLCGGDDYQILFTASPERRARLQAEAALAGVRVTRIGSARSGAGVRALDAAGAPLAVEMTGYRHF